MEAQRKETPSPPASGPTGQPAALGSGPPTRAVAAGRAIPRGPEPSTHGPRTPGFGMTDRSSTPGWLAGTPSLRAQDSRKAPGSGTARGRRRAPRTRQPFSASSHASPTLPENSKWTQGTGKRLRVQHWRLRVWGFRGEGNVEVTTPTYECARNCSVVRFKRENCPHVNRSLHEAVRERLAPEGWGSDANGQRARLGVMECSGTRQMSRLHNFVGVLKTAPHGACRRQSELVKAVLRPSSDARRCRCGFTENHHPALL